MKHGVTMYYRSWGQYNSKLDSWSLCSFKDNVLIVFKSYLTEFYEISLIVIHFTEDTWMTTIPWAWCHLYTLTNSEINESTQSDPCYVPCSGYRSSLQRDKENRSSLVTIFPHWPERADPQPNAHWRPFYLSLMANLRFRDCRHKPTDSEWEKEANN